MAAAKISLVTWRLRRLARDLHWTVSLALGLVAFIIAFYFSAVAPAVERASELRADVARLRASTSHVAVDASIVHDPQADLSRFYSAMARPAQIPDFLRRLHRAAADQRLLVEQAEYRPVPDPNGRLTHYQILVPAKGTYPEVRRFLAQAKRDVPALALDGVAFQRQQIGDEILEAQIKFTLFVDTRAATLAENAR